MITATGIRPPVQPAKGEDELTAHRVKPSAAVKSDYKSIISIKPTNSIQFQQELRSTKSNTKNQYLQISDCPQTPERMVVPAPGPQIKSFTPSLGIPITAPDW
jgi:Tfp pilus assembly protein FimT